MKYRTLTGTGATVSRICLGTMTFGGQVDEAESIRMVHRALDAGVNFIDTADVYTGGVSETITGKALKGKRDGVVLASKVGNQVGQYKLKDNGLTRWHIINGVEACLKRLGTDCTGSTCKTHTVGRYSQARWPRGHPAECWLPAHPPRLPRRRPRAPG